MQRVRSTGYAERPSAVTAMNTPPNHQSTPEGGSLPRLVRLGQTDKDLLRAACAHSSGAVSVAPKWKRGVSSLRKLLVIGYIQQEPGWEMDEPFGGIVTDRGRKANDQRDPRGE